MRNLRAYALTDPTIPSVIPYSIDAWRLVVIEVGGALHAAVTELIRNPVSRQLMWPV